MSEVIRKAFVMKVYEGHEDEYEKRHNPVWEDVEAMIKASGITNYSIVLDPETKYLFAYLEVTDENAYEKAHHTDTVQKWWDSMAEHMETNPDNSPVQRDLKEVFHLD